MTALSWALCAWVGTPIFAFCVVIANATVGDDVRSVISHAKAGRWRRAAVGVGALAWCVSLLALLVAKVAL